VWGKLTIKLEINRLTLGLILWVFIKDVAIFSLSVKYVSILSVVVDTGDLEIKTDLALGIQWIVFDERVVKEFVEEDGFLVGLSVSSTVLFFLLLDLDGIEDCMTVGIGGVPSRRFEGDWARVLKGGEDGGEDDPGIDNIEFLWFLPVFFMEGEYRLESFKVKHLILLEEIDGERGEEEVECVVEVMRLLICPALSNDLKSLNAFEHTVNWLFSVSNVFLILLKQTKLKDFMKHEGHFYPAKRQQGIVWI